MTYYTIFLGDSPWENVIDDMNSHESCGMGYMYWSDKSKAEACMKDLQKPQYGFERAGLLFKVVEFNI